VVLPLGSQLVPAVKALNVHVTVLGEMEDKSFDKKAMKALVQLFKEEKPDIVHTHAKDGIMLNKNQNPTEVYHAFAVGGVEALNACEGFKEVPLGEGEVDWDAYLKALRDVGFDGFLTIERECGENPQADIETATKFLKNKI
jgi:sugar phosphate isomerase/epimerase